MARIARVVAPGIPRHITQRGNRRQETFFCAEDYQAYLALLAEWCGHWKVEVWAYCLMPNHVHVAGRDDRLVTAAPLLALVGDWRGFLATGATEDEVQELRRHERSGRPLGREPFVRAVERTLGRPLRRGKPGPRRGRAE